MKASKEGAQRKGFSDPPRAQRERPFVCAWTFLKKKEHDSAFYDTPVCTLCAVHTSILHSSSKHDVRKLLIPIMLSFSGTVRYKFSDLCWIKGIHHPSPEPAFYPVIFWMSAATTLISTDSPVNREWVAQLKNHVQIIFVEVILQHIRV